MKNSNVDDLEVKDALIIFNTVWNSLVEELGEENLRFPKEIFWLNGAPGAGKGTNTNFIMRYRNLTAPPIVVSSLLNTPESERKKDSGMLVGDREVIEIMLRKLLEPVYKTGAVVDGFPRTKVQVECVKMLYEKLIALKNQFQNTKFQTFFKRPHFHIVVLFIDENESVKRQISRGEKAILHNDEVKASGVGEIIQVRATDLDPKSALNRYKTFKEKTYDALKELRETFFYHFINAQGTIEEVRKRIDSELRYQGSLELDEATYDAISCLPIASTLSNHARQDLVDRLENYQSYHKELFTAIISLISDYFMPIIKRHAISGTAVVNTEDPLLDDPLALSILIDVFSERGFHAVVDVNKEEIPYSVDKETFEIQTRIKKIFSIHINFKASEIRRG
ncbi:MAG: nucleoside monophosphate kinase [Coraliomargaritaceae bacterium]